MAQVNTDGIVMQSDALSADQLALLQKQIQETLRSQVLLLFTVFANESDLLS